MGSSTKSINSVLKKQYGGFVDSTAQNKIILFKTESEAQKACDYLDSVKIMNTLQGRVKL